MTAAIAGDGEYRALLELSAALGADPLSTQAAGGNTSIKRDDIMWIKASGTWLADALIRDIMTPVRIEPLRQALANGDPRAQSAVDFVDASQSSRGLRPSIETSVHAVIPSTIVVHIHCVNTIALAVRSDAENAARARLEPLPDVEFTFVPYVKPGLSLAHAISERSTPRTNVLVLANHGLVVAGETVAEVAERTRRVSAAFSSPVRRAPDADLERLAAIVEGGDYRLPADCGAHAVALELREPRHRPARIALSGSRGLSRAWHRRKRGGRRSSRSPLESGSACADAGLARPRRRASPLGGEGR